MGARAYGPFLPLGAELTGYDADRPCWQVNTDHDTALGIVVPYVFHAFSNGSFRLCDTDVIVPVHPLLHRHRQRTRLVQRHEIDQCPNPIGVGQVYLYILQLVAGRTERVSETVKHVRRRIFGTAPLVFEIIRRQVANVMQPVRA